MSTETIDWRDISAKLRAPFNPADVDFRVQGRVNEQTGRAQGGRKLTPLAQRFAAKYKVTESGCWEWTGYKMRNGYPGYLHFGRRGDGRDYGHRVSYLLAYGSIPEGTELDHLCRNRSCVNPAHLEAVPHRINLLRGEALSAQQARQTHCKRGHEFTSENTTITRDGSRVCKICRRALQNRTDQRARAYANSKRRRAERKAAQW